MKKNNLLMLIIFISLIVMIGIGFSSCTSNKKSIMIGGGGPAAKYKILFERDMLGGNIDIFVMNEDGSGQTNLTNSTTLEHSPMWSPDGTKILFVRSDDIFVMNADGSGQTNLTLTTTLEYSPMWSPVPLP